MNDQQEITHEKTMLNKTMFCISRGHLTSNEYSGGIVTIKVHNSKKIFFDIFQRLKSMYNFILNENFEYCKFNNIPQKNV